jgi:hypothetical protein
MSNDEYTKSESNLIRTYPLNVFNRSEVLNLYDL